jgi:TIR domain
VSADGVDRAAIGTAEGVREGAVTPLDRAPGTGDSRSAPEPTGGRPGRIFISYRREETAYPAGWLYDRLTDHFGSGQVFKDVDSIRLGDDFVEVIRHAVGSCDVLLALIGDKWLTVVDDHGRRRLDDPDDFVRLEIEAALTRGVRVIPILVDDGRMPEADEVPESMAGLIRRQALELSPSRFDVDASRLLRVLDWTLAEVRTANETAAADAAPVAAATPTSAPAAPAPLAAEVMDGDPVAGHDRQARRRWYLGAAAAVVTLAVAVAGIAWVSSRSSSSSADAKASGSTGTGGIEVDSTPNTSSDGLRVSGLAATARHEAPALGDTVTVSYSLTNVRSAPMRLTSTFVGARNSEDDNKDTEEINQGVVLAPGATIRAQGRVFLDQAGTWRMWPCYELPGGGQCPDEWQELSILVR